MGPGGKGKFAARILSFPPGRKKDAPSVARPLGKQSGLRPAISA